MSRNEFLIVALALLVGCAPRPAFRPGEDFSMAPEKSVLIALREAGVRDEQRVAIMAAWDETQQRLRTLGEQAEALLTEWRELDRRDPAFGRKSAELSKQWGKVSGERMAMASGFEGKVASVLDSAQWDRWQQFWIEPAFAGREDGPPGEGGRGGGRRRR